MPYKWPSDTDFALRELDLLDRACPACGRMMHISDPRYRRIRTLERAVQLSVNSTIALILTAPPHPDEEPRTGSLMPHRLGSGFNVFCVGHRRCRALCHSPHPIHLLDHSQSALGGLVKYTQRDQVMLPHVVTSSAQLPYESVDEIVLQLTGFNPKGHRLSIRGAHPEACRCPTPHLRYSQ